eukprot:scaffold228081_cov19-Tisochrysis_lutea.AAC.1
MPGTSGHSWPGYHTLKHVWPTVAFLAYRLLGCWHATINTLSPGNPVCVKVVPRACALASPCGCAYCAWHGLCAWRVCRFLEIENGDLDVRVDDSLSYVVDTDQRRLTFSAHDKIWALRFGNADSLSAQGGRGGALGTQMTQFTSARAQGSLAHMPPCLCTFPRPQQRECQNLTYCGGWFGRAGVDGVLHPRGPPQTSFCELCTQPLALFVYPCFLCNAMPQSAWPPPTVCPSHLVPLR